MLSENRRLLKLSAGDILQRNTRKTENPAYPQYQVSETQNPQDFVENG
jgi:hypothetical protein